jgi:Flp pilus assembly protein TadD
MLMRDKSSNAGKFAARGPGIATLFAALILSACADPTATPASSALAPAERVAAAPNTASARADLTPLAAAHRVNPSDPAAALAYAQALRTSGAKAEALAALDATAALTPSNRRVQVERGLLALDLGDTARAEKLLRQAHDANAPDWRVHSALGAALASRGKQQEAQVQFAKALALAPDHPTVLNNLALSYALDGKGEEAEKLLRKAQRGAPKAVPVQQNLALVLGLRGKYEESRSLAAATLPPAKAGENVAYLEELAGATPVASRAEGATDPSSNAPARKTSASLPQPAYHLGGAPAGQ